MKYEDIENVNKQLKGIDVKGKNYIEVNQRIKAFRMLYPEGTIETEIIQQDTYRFLDEETNVILMKATIKNEEGKILATGTAYEKENSSFINRTSFVENAETSCIGRALAICGIGIDTSIASAEEVLNAINNQDKLKLIARIQKLMSDKGILPNEPFEHFGKSSNEMNEEELKEVIKWLEGK